MEKKLTGYPSIDRPWLKYYSDEAINATTPECSIYQNIYNGNCDYLTDIAIIFFGKKITYKQLFEEIERTAKAFVFYGVKNGDNVAICMPALPETMYTILALNKLGANAIMLNPLFSEEQLVDRINETEAKLLLVANEVYARVKNVIPKTTLRTVISCAAVNALGMTVKLIKRVRGIPDTISWNVFIKQGKSVNCSAPKYVPYSPAIMVYSSGTTGASKGIQLTNNSVNSIITQYKYAGFEMKRQDKFFSQIPIWFSTGICVSMLVPLCLGVTIILEPLYDFDIFYKHIHQYKPNFMITAVGLIDYLVEKHKKDEAYKEFKYLAVGGEYVVPHAELKFNEWLKDNHSQSQLHKGYGMCECGGTVTTTLPQSNVIGSAGIPLAHVTVAAFDISSGKELKYGERGEIRVLSPCRMLGYYKNEEATAKYFKKDDQGRIWACTGDMGYVTEEGCLYVDGRISSSYTNNAGEIIYLFDIERTVLDIPRIRQCKVVVAEINGVKKHVAHISLNESTNIQNILNEIKTHCLDKLPENHIPTLIKIHDSALPVAPSGKLNTAIMEVDIENLIEL